MDNLNLKILRILIGNKGTILTEVFFNQKLKDHPYEDYYVEYNLLKSLKLIREYKTPKSKHGVGIKITRFGRLIYFTNFFIGRILLIISGIVLTIVTQLIISYLSTNSSSTPTP